MDGCYKYVLVILFTFNKWFILHGLAVSIFLCMRCGDLDPLIEDSWFYHIPTAIDWTICDLGPFLYWLRWGSRKENKGPQPTRWENRGRCCTHRAGVRRIIRRERKTVPVWPRREARETWYNAYKRQGKGKLKSLFWLLACPVFASGETTARLEIRSPLPLSGAPGAAVDGVATLEASGSGRLRPLPKKSAIEH